MTEDPFRLRRFVDAQQHTFAGALAELRAGRKAGHWMWFVFPQIAGLGMSAMSREFAISSLAEARAYLAHPVLGARLRDCAQVVAELAARSAEEVFGGIDAVKLRSSVTLSPGPHRTSRCSPRSWTAGSTAAPTRRRSGG